ncbi:MAG: hypothetical protein ACYDDO_14765 [Acidiferrobacterales bacterium]
MTIKEMDKRYFTAMLFLLLAGFTSVHADDSLAGLTDPTRPYGSAGEWSRGHAGLVLQSTLVSPRRRLAVINGREFTVGEHVGGAEITAIRPYEVVLSRAGKQSSLRLLPKLGIERRIDEGAPDAATP